MAYAGYPGGYPVAGGYAGAGYAVGYAGAMPVQMAAQPQVYLVDPCVHPGLRRCGDPAGSRVPAATTPYVKIRPPFPP